MILYGLSGCSQSEQLHRYLAISGTLQYMQDARSLLTRDRFLFLGNHFNYPSRILSIAAKVVIQQIVFTPVFNTYFFGMQAVFTGEPPSGVINRIVKTVPTSMWNSIKLWPAVTAVSFAFIMPQYRFMFSGVFAVIWQTYLSFLNRREEKEVHTFGTP